METERGAKAHSGTEEPTASQQCIHLCELLRNVGLGEKRSMVISHLAVDGAASSRELERTWGLRQPEVSQATIALRKRGWVEARKQRTGGKGRPVNHYDLAVSLPDIAGELEAHKREEINRELARLERLNDLVEELTASSDGATDAPEHPHVG